MILIREAFNLVQCWGIIRGEYFGFWIYKMTTLERSKTLTFLYSRLNIYMASWRHEGGVFAFRRAFRSTYENDSPVFSVGLVLYPTPFHKRRDYVYKTFAKVQTEESQVYVENVYLMF